MKIIKIIFIIFTLFVFNCCVNYTKPPDSNRKYKVRLSNGIGSDYYQCDSVIWINQKHIKLKNKEQIEPFIDIIVPDGVVIRVYLNDKYNK